MEVILYGRNHHQDRPLKVLHKGKKWKAKNKKAGNGINHRYEGGLGETGVQ